MPKYKKLIYDNKQKAVGHILIEDGKELKRVMYETKLK